MLTFGKPWAGFLLLVVGLGGCGPEAPPLDPTPGETKVVYSCEGGRDFAATFRAGRESVLFEAEGQSLELVQVPADSGVAYSNGQVVFRAEGTTAFTEGWQGGDFTACTGDNT